MPKPGRPPKQGRTREGSRTLPVRFTLKEIETIRASAEVEEKTVSDFSRPRLLAPPYTSADADADVETLARALWKQTTEDWVGAKGYDPDRHLAELRPVAALLLLEIRGWTRGAAGSPGRERIRTIQREITADDDWDAKSDEEDR